METFLSTHPILWIRGRRQTDNNSASELGRELLQGYQYQVVSAPAGPLRWTRFARSDAVRRSQIYFQFADPITNAWVAFIVLVLRRPLTAHYMDDVAGGYPLWARSMGLHWIIRVILKHARVVIAISEPMLKAIQMQTGRKGPIGVAFRLNPDGKMPEDDAPPAVANGICFLGSVNPKTNLAALCESARKIRDAGFELYVYTRTSDPKVLAALQVAPLTLCAEVPAAEVIATSRRFAAQLIAFNQDDRSYRFFGVSTPSKLPNTLMARRPVLYAGPAQFWLWGWMARFPDVFLTLDAYLKSPHLVRPSVEVNRARELYTAFCILSHKNEVA